jgi:hypothetical protein
MADSNQYNIDLYNSSDDESNDKKKIHPVLLDQPNRVHKNNKHNSFPENSSPYEQNKRLDSDLVMIEITNNDQSNLNKNNEYNELRNIYNANIYTENDLTTNSNNSWTISMVKMLNEDYKKCVIFSWIHQKQSSKYEKLESNFRVAEVILLAIIGLLTSSVFLTFISSINSDQLTMAITGVEIICIMILSIIKGSRESKDFLKKIEEHKKISDKYEDVSYDIKQQLALNMKDRINGKEFIDVVKKKIKEIKESSPRISEHATEIFKKAIKDNDITLPTIEVENEKDDIDKKLKLATDNLI